MFSRHLSNLLWISWFVISTERMKGLMQYVKYILKISFNIYIDVCMYIYCQLLFQCHYFCFHFDQLNSPIHFKSIWVNCASISHRRDTSFFKYWGELKHQTIILKIVTLEDILCRITSISYWLSENIEGIDLKYLDSGFTYICSWSAIGIRSSLS